MSNNASLASDRDLAFSIFRLTMGINMFLHGYVRIVAGTGLFAAKMSEGFTGTPLPANLVVAFLTVLPFVEALIGVSLILGLMTRWGLFLGGLLISMLVFGTALKSDWSALGTQMVYAISFFLLQFYAVNNRYSLDSLIWKRDSSA